MRLLIHCAIFIILVSYVSGTFDWKLPVAGGLAGGLSSAVIYPIDTLKTMQQTDTKSLTSTLKTIKNTPFRKLYAGFIPSTLGSIPSSALYFGAYENVKKYLSHPHNAFGSSYQLNRFFIILLAASSGNILSSLIFVPKETVKQQMQAINTGTIQWKKGILPKSGVTMGMVCSELYRTKGIAGFYPCYEATLMRNIPSTVIRFVFYEEFRLLIQTYLLEKYHPMAYLIVGALSSAIASAATTPCDVVKTRLSTGLLAPGSSTISSIVTIARDEGVATLFQGAFARVLWSSLYGGIGFMSFEQAKQMLGVAI